jgi:hypothetical protein
MQGFNLKDYSIDRGHYQTLDNDDPVSALVWTEPDASTMNREILEKVRPGPIVICHATRVGCFYSAHGSTEITSLSHLVRPKYDEILLRKTWD